MSNAAQTGVTRRPDTDDSGFHPNYGGDYCLAYDTGCGRDYDRSYLDDIGRLREETDTRVTVESWCEAVGVWAPLVPFASRHHNPIDILDALRQGFERAPVTRATVKMADWDHDNPAFGGDDVPELEAPSGVAGDMAQDFIPFLGGWRIPSHGTGGHSTYVNPNYCHLESMSVDPRWDDVEHTFDSDAEARSYVIRRWASFGRHSGVDVATRLGVHKDTVSKWCLEHDIDWEARRKDGLARLARTVELITAWTSETVYSLAPKLGVAHSTLRDWRNRHVRDTEWAPPIDPSTKPWFSCKIGAGNTARSPSTLADGGVDQ